MKDALGKTIRYGAWIKTENVTDGSATYGGASTASVSARYSPSITEPPA
jgi:hypothetical protein